MVLGGLDSSYYICGQLVHLDVLRADVLRNYSTTEDSYRSKSTTTVVDLVSIAGFLKKPYIAVVSVVAV